MGRELGAELLGGAPVGNCQNVPGLRHKPECAKSKGNHRSPHKFDTSMLRDWMTRIFTGRRMLHSAMLSLPFSMSTPSMPSFYRRLITRLRIVRIRNGVTR